jgi:ATP-binding cassette subfamily C (CFTR/MRP) protein 1
VSSSVDVETERVVQGLIQNEFHGYTIIVVSHRPDMIMDFGSMDRDEIVESDDPISLAGLAGIRFRESLKASSKGQPG